MKIYYSSEFVGSTAYLDMKSHPVLMDCVVVNIEGLLRVVELRLGLHSSKYQPTRRLVAYYKAVHQYMQHGCSYPKLAESYKVSPLATCREMLRWRDALALCGWTASTDAPTHRLKVLQDIEYYYSQEVHEEDYQRYTKVYERLSKGRMLMRDVTIMLASAPEYEHPRVRQLLSLIVDDGATIKQLLPIKEASTNNLSRIARLLAGEDQNKVTLDEADDSFQVWHFKDELSANEYLAMLPDGTFDVAILPHSKQTDNYLRLMGKPSVGSTVDNSAPQIVQLFFLGIALLQRPLNVNILIQWLYSPVHPLPAYLRYRLAKQLARTGGWYNKDADSEERAATCYQCLQAWIDGQYESEHDNPIDEDEKARRKELASVYLPDFDNEASADVSVERINQLLDHLSAWCKQRLAMVGLSTTDVEQNQFHRLCELCDTFSMIIEIDNVGGHIPNSIIEKHLASLYESASFVQYAPQAGCMTTVNHCAQIAAEADKILWTGLYNYHPSQPATDFLTPTEREVLEKELDLWDPNLLRKAQAQFMLQPWRFCQKQLVLVMLDKYNGQLAEKHPLIVQLEQQISNFKQFVTSPSLPENGYVEVEPIDNSRRSMDNPQYVQIQNTALLQWSQTESPTSIESLIQYPIDYVLKRLAHIEDNGQSDLANVYTTKGNVAHGVIEHLFYKEGDKASGYPDAIRERIRLHYHETLDMIIQKKGAILLMPENIIERRQLEGQLLRCLYNLVDIMANNHLHVLACEMPLKGNTLGAPNELTPKMAGFADMILADERERHVVFDFKWTNSKNHFYRLLKNNESVQLAIYAELLTELSDEHDVPIAYYLMPMGRLYTTYPFAGSYVERVKVDEDKTGDIVHRIVNSYIYRRNEIQSGRIELGEEEPLSLLDYFNDTTSLQLLPLKGRGIGKDGDDLKSANIFSNYINLKD